MAPAGQNALGYDESFEAIYHGHVVDVYRFSLSRLRDPQDAEDVTQTTFLNAYQALRAGHRPLQLRPWLIAVAGNICHDHHRQALRRPVLEPLRDLPAAERDTGGMRDLVDGLAGLPEQQRLVLLRHELGGVPRSEIARDLGTTDANVSSLIDRARRNLREQLIAGMSCERARALSEGDRDELSARDRRTMDAHRRFCTTCAEPGRFRSALGVFGTLGPLVWRVVRRTGRPESGAASLGVKGAGGIGGIGGIGATLAGKAVLVAGVAAISGGVVYETHSGHPSLFSRHSTRAPARAPAPAAAGQTHGLAVPPRVARLGRHRLVLVHSRPSRAVAKPHASRPAAAVSTTPTVLSRTAPPPPPAASASALPDPTSSGVSPATPVSTPSPPSAGGSGSVADPVAPGAQAPAEIVTTDTVPEQSVGQASATAPGRQTAVAGDGAATVPGKSTATKGNPGQGGAQATAPGQQESPGNGAGQLTAPGQQANPGNGAGQLTAPGRQESPGNGAGQLTAPGQQGNPGNGAGQVTAPGQQGNPGNGAGQVTAPGQQGNPGNGAGQVTAPGQQENPGNGAGQVTAPGQQGNPGNGAGQVTAPGQLDNPGNGAGQVTAPGQQESPGNGAGQVTALGQLDNPGNDNGNSKQKDGVPIPTGG